MWKIEDTGKGVRITIKGVFHDLSYHAAGIIAGTLRNIVAKNREKTEKNQLITGG